MTLLIILFIFMILMVVQTVYHARTTDDETLHKQHYTDAQINRFRSVFNFGKKP